MSLGWKMLRFRNEQRAGWQRGVEKPVRTCRGPDGGEEDGIEWSRATGVRAGTCCSGCIAPGRRKDEFDCPREAAAFSRELLRAGTLVRDFLLLPSRRHCVCFQPPPERVLKSSAVPPLPPSVFKVLLERRGWRFRGVVDVRVAHLLQTFNVKKCCLHNALKACHKKEQKKGAESIFNQY